MRDAWHGSNRSLCTSVIPAQPEERSGRNCPGDGKCRTPWRGVGPHLAGRPARQPGGPCSAFQSEGPTGYSCRELTTGLATRSAIECRTRGGVRHHNGNKWRYEGVYFRAELPWESVCMSILENFDVDPETKRVLRIAVERTRMSLGLTDGLADGIIANQIIEFAKAGERNPDLLCEGALKKLREHLFGD
jgi:hypothetical protein